MITHRYAVIGNPVAHSKSPLIHAAFAKQFNLEVRYERVLAPLDGFSATVTRLIAQGYKGVNVTVPFKFEAFNLATQHSNSALNAEAANTLTFAHEIYAENTDGIGIVRDIQENLNVKLAGKKILLLGAGGAAQGVLHPILEAHPRLLVIANRNANKAFAMAEKAQSQPVFSHISITGQGFENLETQAFDMIINATSAGLSDSALPISHAIFSKGGLAYDMMYGRETPFMKEARAHNMIVADGLGMLVEQAAEAFYIWHGVRPETRSVMNMIKQLPSPSLEQ